MDFQVPIQIKALPQPIHYQDGIMLMGSCFTEHIGNKLAELKFQTLQNPHGILFDPASIAASLVSYIQQKQYGEEELFQYNELWQSWSHHGRFANKDKQACLDAINASQQQAHRMLKEASWLVITPGTAYSYRLTDTVPENARQAIAEQNGVANCHKAPGNWFEKHLLTIEEIISVFDNCMHQLFFFNRNLKIIFTVSPVRHIRDGLVENNRSKARLLEAVHHLVNKFDRLFYFPAYELVMDVLRDYRFYEADMVHPNNMATGYVMDQFMNYAFDESTRKLAGEIQKLVQSRLHKPLHPGTASHRQFMQSQLQKATLLQQRYPYLNLDSELAYFSGTAH